MAEDTSPPGTARGTSSKVVPALACALILGQTGTIGWLLQERVTLTDKLAALAQSTTVPPGTSSFRTPQLTPGNDIVIPPLPTLPAEAPAPPSPALATMPVVPTSVPPLPAGLPPSLQAALTPAAPQPAIVQQNAQIPAPLPTPSSGTGNAQVDEILTQAREARELGAPDVALEALQQAEQLLPDNALVKRELAFTLQKMGRMDEARAVSGAPAPVGTTPVAKGPIRLGTCQLGRDMTSPGGLRSTFSVPLMASAADRINAAEMNVDVFFYEKEESGRVELRRGREAQFSFDERVDFATGTEYLTVTFDAPTEEDIAQYGKRSFFGYVVKLWYRQQLIDAQASPTTLLQQQP
jgi:hypothetical protein